MFPEIVTCYCNAFMAFYSDIISIFYTFITNMMFIVNSGNYYTNTPNFCQ